MRSQRMYLLSMTFLCLLGFSGLAQANSLVFSDRTAFLSASGAADITPTLTTFTGMGASLNIDGLTFSNPFGKTVFAGVWTPLLPGNDIAINDNEDIDVTLPGDVFALGFDIHEPTGSASTFTATLFNGATSVDSFTFDPPDDVAAFVGIWSDQTFNRLEVREATAINQDEYFGHFYAGNTPLQAVPEPNSLVLFGLGALGVLGYGQRRLKRMGSQSIA